VAQSVARYQVVGAVEAAACTAQSYLSPGYVRMSYWDATKSGSDNITKLVWNAMSSPPNRLPQAHAIAR
jgi:hypothetical protein